MKKSKSPKPSHNLDKQLLEAGQQCKKRLWLDCHRPVTSELTATRRALADVGKQLLDLARSAFPKGVLIAGKTMAKAAEETTQQLEAGANVLFGAAFCADGTEVVCDILVRHKDNAVDLYEVKSGAKIKQRYLSDLALQAHVLEAAGLEMRAAFLLHLNPKYEHKEGADLPAMQVLRSADVTERVRKQLPHLRARIDAFRKVLGDESVLKMSMGTFCRDPLPCPHLAECGKNAPKMPAYELPDLTRDMEMAFRREGISELSAIDPERAGLTTEQRRLLESIAKGKLIVEDFIREELQNCTYPLHFVSTATLTDALPRFEGQKPWRRIPYAWAANTLYKDGRVETARFTHFERTDPRLAFMSSLGKHLEVGGTLICWDGSPIESLRTMLEDLPAAKIAVRAVIGRAMVDMMHLFDAGVFHPELRGHRDLITTVSVLLDDPSGRDLSAKDEDSVRELLDKAWAPRIRSTTREKIGAELEESVVWHCDQLLRLYRKFGGVEEKRPAAKRAGARAPAKALPKLPEE